MEITQKEIDAIKKEFYEEHTIIGTDKPVVLDDETATIILKSRKRHEEWVNSVHSSHEMTDWYAKILAPVGTPRFYSCRHCKKCEGMQYHHPAGKFMEGELKMKCEGE